MKNKVYTGITVKCGKIDSLVVHDVVCETLQKKFPSFEEDGGGTDIRSNQRDIFFFINSRSKKKAIQHLKSEGFKLVDSQ